MFVSLEKKNVLFFYYSFKKLTLIRIKVGCRDSPKYVELFGSVLIAMGFMVLGRTGWSIKYWAPATNSNFQIPLFLKSDGINLWYIQLKSFDPTKFIILNL